MQRFPRLMRGFFRAFDVYIGHGHIAPSRA